MTSLAEMATYIPLTGSFAAYASKFVSPATGFALGWNYWFNAAITVPVEITTVGLVMNFWLPHVPAWVFSGVAFILIFIINYLSVRDVYKRQPPSPPKRIPNGPPLPKKKAC